MNEKAIFFYNECLYDFKNKAIVQQSHLMAVELHIHLSCDLDVVHVNMILYNTTAHALLELVEM